MLLYTNANICNLSRDFNEVWSLFSIPSHLLSVFSLYLQINYIVCYVLCHLEWKIALVSMFNKFDLNNVWKK